jgi:hypothetical protein
MKTVCRMVMTLLFLLPIQGGLAAAKAPGFLESYVIPFPQLFWAEHPQAFRDPAAPVEYEIQIAKDAGFNQVADEDTVALARYVPDRPLPAGRYFWRVRAVPAGKPAEAWSEIRGFEINPPNEVITVECDPDAKNHQPAVQAAVDRAVALNQQGRSVEIRFSPGVYRVRNARQFFSIEGATNLILNGEGAVVHLMEYDMGAGRIMNSRNVLVSGFTIDYPKQQTFLQARVLEVDAAQKTITVEFDPAGDTFDEPYVMKGFSTFSLLGPGATGRLKTGAANFYRALEQVEKIGERTFRIQLTRSTAGIEAGDRMIHFVRKGGQSLFFAENSENLTYYQVTNHASGGGHYVGVSCSQIAVLHCRSDIYGDRWYGANADGVHIRSNRIGPWIEGTTFNAIGDDGVALYSRPVRASKSWPDGQRNALIITPAFFDLEPGDNVSFFNPAEGRIFLETRVKEVAPAGKDFRVVFEDDIPREMAYGKSLQDDDQIWNRSTSNGDFMIRNSRFTNIRRFGTVFRADKGVVENCVYEGTSSSAIVFFNETQYPNGLYCSDIIIRNNTIHDCAFDTQPLGVMAFEFRRRASGQLAADYGPRRILIENNRISGSAAIALQVGSARDLILRGNTVDGAAMGPEHARLQQTEGVQWPVIKK